MLRTHLGLEGNVPPAPLPALRASGALTHRVHAGRAGTAWFGRTRGELLGGLATGEALPERALLRHPVRGAHVQTSSSIAAASSTLVRPY
jgi:hypothetical protein